MFAQAYVFNTKSEDDNNEKTIRAQCDLIDWKCHRTFRH